MDGHNFELAHLFLSSSNGTGQSHLVKITWLNGKFKVAVRSKQPERKFSMIHKLSMVTGDLRTVIMDSRLV